MVTESEARYGNPEIPYERRSTIKGYCWLCELTVTDRVVRTDRWQPEKYECDGCRPSLLE